MRSIAMLAACAATSIAAAPLVAHAQFSTTTTTTINSDANTIWEKIKGSWAQTKGAIKEQWGKLTDDDLMEIEGRREQLWRRCAEVFDRRVREEQSVAFGDRALGFDVVGVRPVG